MFASLTYKLAIENCVVLLPVPTLIRLGCDICLTLATYLSASEVCPKNNTLSPSDTPIPLIVYDIDVNPE